MKNKNPKGLFDEDFLMEKLTTQGDPLVKLKELIDWEQFRPILNSVFEKEKKSEAGREPFDYLMMFKVLIIQKYYNLSDGQAEFQILDRASFKRFLNLGSGDKVPDEKTIWTFREALKKANAMEKLFDRFRLNLTIMGYIGKDGKIVDASFVEAPRQRNTRAENELIKNGEIPEDWKNEPHKLAQKDTEAKWTKKNNETFYGYKDHVKICRKSKLIDKYLVTDASVHDSQPLEDLLTEEDKDQGFWADSAYTGDSCETVIADNNMKNNVHEKGYRNNPLTEKQKKRNTKKSRIRVRVEHVFGFIENSMKGSITRKIGMARAKVEIGLMNLTYNFFRTIFLIQSGFKGELCPVQ
jgi:transposase, IS5 family